MNVSKFGPATDFLIVKGCQILANLAPLETPKLSREVTSWILKTNLNKLQVID